MSNLNSAEMLTEFFNSMTNEIDDDEQAAELVVTALGTSGTHYICWKTNSGEYRQRKLEFMGNFSYI